jgi:hypothetical protein
MKKERYETSAKVAFYSLIAMVVLVVIGLLIEKLK